MSFVHLHCHTEYSLLDGLARIGQLIARVKELGQPAVAITDHGALYGVVEFWHAAVEAGIKPIIGMEAYLARGKMSERLPGEESKPYHLLLLAYNQTGYQNLLRLASLAQLEGFYYKPRVDKETLAAHSAGLICTTGCLAAEIPRLLTEEGRPEKARREIGWYREVFGAENFFFEVQSHDIPAQRDLNRALYELQSYFDVPFVATNDVHYVMPEDAEPHDILLCIQTGKVVSDPTRLKMSDASYYLKSRAEMAAELGEFPGALDNTLLIAERCEVNLKTKGYHLPPYPVPDGHTPETYLRHICEAGLQQRYGERASDPEVRGRLEYELQVIHTMGFDTYFLIVWDLCRYARERGIWWNVRGSGASSIVAYTCGITNLDPLRNSLIFERFLNPGRISMPDIDIDYPDDQREIMIQYAVQKYGQENVAQIITFGTLGARAAIRDVGRAMDIPLPEVDRLARLVPAGPKVKLRDAFENHEFKELYESREYIRRLVDTAMRLEGVNRHASTHAAGVVIADKPLVEYLPLHRPTKDTEGSALGTVTQFPMEIVEKIGLLKIDFLGLATLTAMRRACEMIAQRHGVHYDLTTIPFTRQPDDAEKDARVKKLFDLLASGHVDGVFQVESEGMRKVLTAMRPTEFEHIIAVVALYRPGPMDYIPTYIKRMHGEEPVTYHHPDLAPILQSTYGIIVYQEQIIQIATKLAGYSPGEADQIRKAVGKKKQEEIARHRKQFIDGAVRNGYSPAVAEAVYGDIEFFANYGFNKSHAADYAMITCQTAYLKAHYPVEYMTALLSVFKNDTARIALYIADARRMGIPVLPPDINSSELDFSMEALPPERSGTARWGIRFGLAAVKNVGEGAVQVILDARAAGGQFASLDDFCRRVDLRAVGKRALECLIKVGALDRLGERGRLLAGLDQIMSVSAAHFRAAEFGQLSLFGGSGGFGGIALPPVKTELPRRDKLAWEKELIGLYISDHPLQPVMDDVQKVVTHYSRDLTENLHGKSVVMAGIITSVRPHQTRKGEAMGFVSLEDLQGPVELVIFPKVWKTVSSQLKPEQIVAVRGKVDAKGSGTPKIIVDELMHELKITQAAPAPTPPAEAAAYELPPYLDELPPLPEEEWIEEMPSAAPEDNFSSRAETTAGAPPDGRDPAAASHQTPAAENQPAVGGGQRSTTTPPPADSGRPSRCITVIFRASGDYERDVRRMRRVHGLLTSYPGRDQFEFRIYEYNRRNYQVRFPNDSTGYCPALEQQLTELLGPGAVEVRTL